ncbi:putative glutathione transferase [Helianthus debilis subsp. tardiflorus]
MDSQDQNLDGSPPLLTNNPTSVKKSARGVNFSPEEDKLLVSAWLSCDIDAIQGTDQKHTQLWEKIYEYFQQHKETATERSIKSLTNRWSCIQKATNAFCATLAQVEGLNKSSMTYQDKIEKANIMYESQEKCRFQFRHCWQLLKDQPKWISRDVKQRKMMFQSPTPTLNPTPIQCSGPIDDSVFDLETGNVIENDVIELDRPTSRKSEEGKRKAHDTQAEEIIRLKKMKYTLLEESRAQEDKIYRYKAEKMEYDKEKEEKKLRLEEERLRLEAEKIRQEDERLRLEAEKIRQEDERLRIKAEKTEIEKREADQRIMMMDVSVMPEMQRLYFEELRREIMLRRRQT